MNTQKVIERDAAEEITAFQNPDRSAAQCHHDMRDDGYERHSEGNPENSHRMSRPQVDQRMLNLGCPSRIRIGGIQKSWG